MLELADFIDSNPGDPSILPPLVHVTEGSNLYTILNSQQLDPQKCNIVDTPNTVFMFVGKPAFKLKSKPESNYWDAPIAFIFDKAVYSQVDSLYAVDTGALQSGRYSNVLGTRNAKDVALPPHPDSVSAMVQAFFGSVDNYYSSIAKSPERMKDEYKIAPSGIKILALAALYNASKSDNLDDRKSTLEAQSIKPVPIKKSILRGIILPEEWLADAKGIKAPLLDMKCEIQSYDIYPIDRIHYTSEMYRLCKLISIKINP